MTTFRSQCFTRFTNPDRVQKLIDDNLLLENQLLFLLADSRWYDDLSYGDFMGRIALLRKSRSDYYNALERIVIGH